MKVMTLWLLYSVLAGFSFILTAALGWYALANSLMDIPNARSSHVVATPRGGGVAIVFCFLVGVSVLLYLDSMLPARAGVGFIGAGLVVAVVGFMDDHGHIAARWRLLAHFSAAGWGLYWLGGLPVLTVLGWDVDLGAIGYLFAALYLVWLLNLYNFMDGIDGIASVEAISVCLGGAGIFVLQGGGYGDAAVILPLLLAFSVAGFLVWNFPPAKIFMGDAGSGFLGITLGLLSIQAAHSAPQLFWSWLILLGVFIVDATYTLFRRLLRGDKVYEPHRSHAYQYAARRYGQHRFVTLSVLMINLCWLIPLACLPALGLLDGVLSLTLAYIPLIVLAVCFHAGELESQVKSDSATPQV